LFATPFVLSHMLELTKPLINHPIQSTSKPSKPLEPLINHPTQSTSKPSKPLEPLINHITLIDHLVFCVLKVWFSSGTSDVEVHTWEMVIGNTYGSIVGNQHWKFICQNPCSSRQWSLHCHKGWMGSMNTWTKPNEAQNNPQEGFPLGAPHNSNLQLFYFDLELSFDLLDEISMQLQHLLSSV